jgi:hypothetical protein
VFTNPDAYEEAAMKYLCLVYLEQRTMDALSPAEGVTLTRDSLGYDDDLRRSGHYITSNALQSPEAATTVLVRNGRISTTDGPFAETKEHLGGFILIDARDLNEAIQIAAGIPLAKLGSVEVRPIKELR